MAAKKKATSRKARPRKKATSKCDAALAKLWKSGVRVGEKFEETSYLGLPEARKAKAKAKAACGCKR